MFGFEMNPEISEEEWALLSKGQKSKYSRPYTLWCFSSARFRPRTNFPFAAVGKAPSNQVPDLERH